MIVNFLNLGMQEMLILFSAFIWTIIFVIAFVKYITNKQFTPIEKAVWVLVICLAPLFGAIAYFIAHGSAKKQAPVREY